MKRDIGLMLLGYSVVLAGLIWLVVRLFPAVGLVTFITGLAGAGLCVLWGVLALSGKLKKALIVLTLGPVGFVLLSRTVMAWMGDARLTEGRGVVAGLLTLLLLLTVAVLMRVAYFGVTAPGQLSGPRHSR